MVKMVLRLAVTSLLLILGLLAVGFCQEAARDTVPPRAVVAMRMSGGVLCSTSLRLCWTGIDDVTPTGKLLYSWKLDDAKWTAYSDDTRTELTGLSEGPHTFTVRAKDEAGNEEAEPRVERFYVCLSAPRISGLTVAPAGGEATVTWTTDVPCFSRVEFGQTSAYGSTAMETPGVFTEHNVVLGGLEPGRTYHCRIVTKNVCEIASVSADQVFTTKDEAVPAGATAPDCVVYDALPEGCGYVTVSRRPQFARNGRPVVDRACSSVGEKVVFTAPPGLTVKPGEERDTVPNGGGAGCPDMNITAIVPRVEYLWTLYGPSGALLMQGPGLESVSVDAMEQGEYRCAYEARWSADVRVMDPSSGVVDMGSATSACANWDLRVEIVGQTSDRISLETDRWTGEPYMPDIRARARTAGGRLIDRDEVKWKALLRYQSDQHASKAAPWRVLNLDSSEVTKVGEVTIGRAEWGGAVACGEITLIAEYVDASGRSHKGVSRPLILQPGSAALPWGNPEPWMIRKALRDILDEVGDPDLSNCYRALYSICFLESGLRQFWESLPGSPCWSGDRLGGVGLMQITYPAPTLEQTWNWKANIRGGVAIFKDKIQVVRDHVASVQESFDDPDGDYHKALDKYNEANHPLEVPVTVVEVQPWTQDMTVRDAIRCYNGAPGRDPVGRRGLHEFQIKFENGVPALTNVRIEERGGVKVGVATALWEAVTLEMRLKNYEINGVGSPGSANYVNKILDSRIEPGDPLPMR